MGRSRKQRRAERQLEEALASQRLSGRREGAASEREALLISIASRLFSEETGEVAAELERSGFREALAFIAERVSVWASRWIERLSAPLLRQMQDAPMVTDRGPVKLSFSLANPRLKDYFDGYLVELSTQITSTTQEKLTSIIREASEEGYSVPETAKRIRELGEDFGKARSELTARDQLHKASIGASEIQARESGVVSTQTWRDSDDFRVRPEHKELDGVTVGIDEEFPEGKHPKTEIACRCYIEYGIDMAALEARTA